MTLAHRYKLVVNACWIFAGINLAIASLVLFRVTHKYNYNINVQPPQQIVITNYTRSVTQPSDAQPSVSGVALPPVLSRFPLNYGFCSFDGANAISYNGRIYHVGDYLLGHVIVSVSRSVIICDDCIFYFDNTTKELGEHNGNISI